MAVRVFFCGSQAQANRAVVDVPPKHPVPTRQGTSIIPTTLIDLCTRDLVVLSVRDPIILLMFL